MASSLSLVLTYVVILSFFIFLNFKETFSSRLLRSQAKLAQTGADDYPSSGRNTPVHDLGFPEFPSFQEAVAPPPPPSDLPLLPPPAFSYPEKPRLPEFPSFQPPPPPDVPLLSPPAFPDPEKPKFPVPVWPSLPVFQPFPFVDHAAPAEPSAPRYDESDWMPSIPSDP